MRSLNLPWAALLAAATIVLGTLFRWVNVLFVSVNGIELGDGKLVLALALTSATLLIASARRRWAVIVAGVAGLGSLGVTAYDAIRISAFHKHIFGASVDATAGVGLWIDVIASALLVAAIAWHLQVQRGTS